ncbi:DUF6968 family protein [Nonomuraea sp. SYSU D8015]|uniref:DUF6968 family protein n=1 Tax=Nonomuraea sp. SYSU D8015 TaxID=2593644 RepID=UPI00166120A8|nr:hypothetical protein [Nonomuraea sp. SYSU D8015]
MTVTYELGEVVAERQLEAVAEDGARTPVTVRFGRPRPDALSTTGDWCCPHQILGLGEEGVGASFGVDSLQALLLSVYKVRLELGERARAASVRLEWLGLPDLGLEVTPDFHDTAATEKR